MCSVYNYDTRRMEFRCITDETERDAALGSKYVQSDLTGIFNTCVEWLNSHNEKKILFLGTGCQADAFSSFMQNRGYRERVMVIDLVCHGVPSPLFFEKYLSDLGGGNVSFVTFKDKRNGWNRPTSVAVIDGKEISTLDYLKLYDLGFIIRPSCYKCPYTSLDRRTDITIGDFWGIENINRDFYSPDGNSLVIIHSDKGNLLFNNILSNAEYFQSDEFDCLQPNLINPSKEKKGRDVFWSEFKTKGIRFIRNKYSLPSHIYRFKENAKHLFK